MVEIIFESFSKKIPATHLAEGEDMIINPTGKKLISVSTDFLGRKLTLEVGKVGFRSTSKRYRKIRRNCYFGNGSIGLETSGARLFPTFN